MYETEFADDATLDRARAGDADALAAIWRIYQPQLLRYLSSQATGATDDVASQVWLDVERSISGFEGDGEAFRRWLFTIGRRRAIDFARREQRRREVSVDPLDGAIDGDVDEEFDVQEHLDPIKILLSELPPDMAQVLMLRVVRDLSVAETAEQTGLSEANVRVLMHRGLGLLRRMLTPVAKREPAEPEPAEREDAGVENQTPSSNHC